MSKTGVPMPDDLRATMRERYAGTPQGPSSEVLCSNGGDNAALNDLLRRLRTLRCDSDCFGELLATLCIPSNREAIRAGEKDDLDYLFDLIDAWSAGHKQRLAGIDGKPTSELEAECKGEHR